jgi:cell division protein FtsQ
VAVAAALVIVAVTGLAGKLWRQVGHVADRFHLGEATVEVSGNHYLSAEEVLAAAGLSEMVSFFDTDLDEAGEKLRSHSRVRMARLERRFNGRIRIHVDERVPVALVSGRELREVDREGELLPPLLRGAVADLPVLCGLDSPRKGHLDDPDFQRALAWLAALGEPAVDLTGRVSEIDVGSARETRVILVPDGTRVLLPVEPGSLESLCALRVVLADLEVREIKALRIDCRARGMVVVRPAPGSKTARESDPLTAQKTAGGSAATL